MSGETKKVKKQRGARSYERSGHDDRAAALEFQHMNLREMNRKLEEFLLERDINYGRMKRQPYGRCVGMKKRKGGES